MAKPWTCRRATAFSSGLLIAFGCSGAGPVPDPSAIASVPSELDPGTTIDVSLDSETLQALSGELAEAREISPDELLDQHSVQTLDVCQLHLLKLDAREWCGASSCARNDRACRIRCREATRSW